MIGLPELKGGATIVAELATATRSMGEPEKPQKRPRKVSDDPDKKETWRSDEGLQSKKERDGWRGQTRILLCGFFIAVLQFNRMAKSKSVDGFNTLICEEDLRDEEHPYPHCNQDRQQVSMSSMTLWRHCRLAAVSLALLAVILLIVDISLGVHYNKLKDTYLTLDDTEYISKELAKLQDTYKTAIETTKGYNKQLDSEMSRQKQINWEFEHQTKRSTDYEAQMVTITNAIAALRSHLPIINDGCRHCSPGWILMNSLCYYFPFSDITGYKTWQKAREFCQMHGGDLAVIDSKDKENSTVNLIIQNAPKNINGFWIGLRDVHEEGTWKWLDGTILVEGYWNDGEPNDINEEDCAAVYPRENFFKAWNDVRCGATMKWICEKASISS